MACIEYQDLSELAEEHITVQNAVVERQKRRLSDLRTELEQTPEDSPRHQLVKDAVEKLSYYIEGEGKSDVDDRVAMMEALYTDRAAMEFHDTTRENIPRKASIFGMPTIKEMVERGYDDILEELIVRSVSLIEGGKETWNPVDFVDIEGMEVKDALSNKIEYHHIFNNVKLDENGRIQFKSFKLRQDPNRPGVIKLDIVPAYWGGEEHGRNNQFIALMDGAHAGEDPITHLHFYEMNAEEQEQVKAKIKADLPKIRKEAQDRVPRLKKTLRNLESRHRDPIQYEQDLLEKRNRAIAARERIVADKKFLKTATPEQKAHRTLKMKRLKAAAEKAEKDYDNAVKIRKGRQQMEQMERRIKRIEDYCDSIKLNRRPYTGKSPEALAKKAKAMAFKERLFQQAKGLTAESKALKEFLKKNGDIEEDIRKTKLKIQEQEMIAQLSESEALDLFEQTNGFFSLDKGHTEKEAHTKYRGIMSQQINQLLTREAIEYLQKEYGAEFEQELGRIMEKHYRSNLLAHLESVASRVR